MIGQRLIPTVGPDGAMKTKCSQVAEVAVPLTSIGEMCDDGQVVAFGKNGWVVWDSRTEQTVHHPRVSGIYCLEEWVPPIHEQQQQQQQQQMNASGFPRPA